MTIDALKATIGGRGGINQPNRFKITFNPPGGGLNGREITLLCQSVNIPGRQITSFEYPFDAVSNEVKVPNGYVNDDITCVFLITNDFSAQKMFNSWRKAIITDDYLLNYVDAYERDVTITALNQKNETAYTVLLKGAYPITVNSIQLDNGTMDEVTRLEVTFTYIDFEGT